EKALKEVWYILDCPCGRRLGDYIGEIVPILEKKGEIKITEEGRCHQAGYNVLTIGTHSAPGRIGRKRL
ncbi:MAG TPA: hypothetical protein PLW95_07165, partial [bacterium]|nr:hypothetical protein [bacterium]